MTRRDVPGQRLPARTGAGFSLVELVVVLVLLAVLSVTAAVRFSDRTGIAEYTYQQRFISALRQMQLRAMQDTRSGFCHRIVLIYTSGSQAFGPASGDYSTGNESATCATTIDFSTTEALRTSSFELGDENVTLSSREGRRAVINYVGFDSLGRPLTNNFSCQTSNGCTVTFTGNSAANVCIEREGYIYAC